MLCPNCHAENGSDSKFCEHCGANIAEIRKRLEEEGYAATTSRDEPVETNNPADQEPRCPKCGKQIPQNSKFCENCGASQETSVIRPVTTAVTQQGKGKLENWLTQKNLIGLAAVLIATALFYYFLVRPIQERRAYEDCLGALTETGGLPSGITTSEKNFRIDACVKGRAASRIRNTYEQNKELSDAANARARAVEEAAQNAKRIEPYSMANIAIKNIKSESLYYGGNEISGSIENKNNFDVTQVVIQLVSYSDKAGTNKIDQVDCSLGNFTVYANSTKNFSTRCDYQGSWYRTSIKTAEKAL